MKSGNPFQSDLSNFLFKVAFIMLFFMSAVMMGCHYILNTKFVVHFMGGLKSSAEAYAFLFSGVALLIMIFPSMKLLYGFNSQSNYVISVKVVASQWYWSFEISDVYSDPVVMSALYLNDLSVGENRYLEVDNRLVLPSGMMIRFNITSSDVIHSFAMPTLGMKVDASSGLLTIVPVFTSKIGTHYGQCSEICGMNHAFMPVCIEVTTFINFLYESSSF